MKPRLAAAALALVLALAPSAGAQASVPSDTSSDANWILTAQMPDGGIAHHTDKVAIWPYLSNFAATGLASATAMTADKRYVEASWRWLEWYQARQDASGFVTDYKIQDGAPVSTGDMDSTDAYAGTFLLAAEKAWRVTRDDSRLRSLRPGIVGAVKAIEATQDLDGLTWAKPSWRVKYLMDQAETYAGLRSAVNLANGPLRDRTLANRAGADAQRMFSGIERLWNSSTNSYDWAVHGDGSRTATNWSVFYPDALQQVWPVAFGLVTGDRAALLLRQFEAAHPQWDRPTATATYSAGPKPVGYVAVAGWAFAKVGNYQRARVAETNIRMAANAAGRAWPFTPGDAGQLITLRSLAYGYRN